VKLIGLTIILFLLSVTGTSQLISYDQLDTAHVYTDLGRALVNPSKVYRLDLTKSKLKVFPGEIKLMTNLNELILDKNKIGDLPKDIRNLQYLQRLSCSKCRLQNFIPQICDLEHLVELDLSNNSLSRIPDEIEKLQKLKRLILWENVIGYYSPSLMDLENLKVLDLLHNEMSHEEQRILKDMLPNTDLHLSLPCDCEFDDE
jgi:Leucine-rich repeat (LRR) protein